jgi:hypothetical protein
VADIYPVKTFCATSRTVAGGKDYDLALLRCNHFCLGLCPGTLLKQQKLPARIVAPWLAQKAGHLQGERQLAVKILVQTVVPVVLIVQK